MKTFRLLCLFLLLFETSFAQEKSEIKWWSPSDSEVLVIANQAWSDELNSIYHRLPGRAKENVNAGLWSLSKNAAGLAIRFWSNAKKIHVKYKLKGDLSMPHMPETGVSGLDLYSKSENGEWLRSWGSYSIGKKSSYNFNVDEPSDLYKKYGREYQLFLPLYNEVDSLEIGVGENSFFTALPVRKEKPIVAYGTSICQGACTSRPGMTWTNILERKLERPIINLGFSGNGRLEPALIELMIEIDAKLYVLDCLPNLNPTKDDTYQLAMDAVRKLKETRPEVPVILTEHIGYADELANKVAKEKCITLNKELNRAINDLRAEGFRDVFVLKKETLGLDFDSFVDYIHPNDIGMKKYADAYEDLIREILSEPTGDLSTTIPKTQSRDIAAYQWEARHQEILKLNSIKPPKIALFGNSIINFWGGEPLAPIVRGQDSWDRSMSNLEVRNFGFGWDRIENVLWRVYHGELDGFEAEKIVLMIGTNNLHINSDAEIVSGLEFLIKAIKSRQQKAQILMMGILPRSGDEVRVAQINKKIQEMVILLGEDYANINKSLLRKNGSLDESLFSDGLHPNEDGYTIIAKELEKVIQ